jgi:adenylate cyclase
MIDRPKLFRLGGERRNLSILFSDVRDFTALAEEIGPEDVSNLLNEYLTPMTRIIFESRGTLDKYIGDAIVAFWGAPLPVESHPMKACEAAVAMQEEVRRFRSTRKDLPGADRLSVGIGIHCGDIVVGNMGSDLRFDYSVTGDGVNLCSRLEALTKHYGVGIIASSHLVGRIEGFATRELDSVRVKGKQQAVRLFEVLGPEDPGAEDRELLATYGEGLAAYRKGSWSDAERLLRRVLTLRQGRDGPSEVLLRRIEQLRSEPPSEWNGIWTFEEK